MDEANLETSSFISRQGMFPLLLQNPELGLESNTPDAGILQRRCTLETGLHTYMMAARVGSDSRSLSFFNSMSAQSA